ncbi:ester cyclase [Chitinispirillales bacterium ANBcel5]|uniref:ester cyclase n=1 Tax=Cellulosispirillum alkaliphilum TaxID=3039283 RepID=UPI002A59730F|nr:ester cyclase [Chitinispirillales bacterium ANBcel5]
MNDSTQIELIKRLYPLISNKNYNTVLELCSPDAVWIYPTVDNVPYSGVWKGQIRIKAFLERFTESEDIMEYAPLEFIGNEGRFAVLGQLRSVARPAGRLWQSKFIHTITIKDQQITHFEAGFDTAAALKAHQADREISEKNKEIIMTMIERIKNGGDIDLADALIGGEYIYRSTGGGEYHGKDGLRSLVASYRDAFPDFRIRVEQMVSDEHAVASHCTIFGTHKGKIMGIAPTGKRVKIPALIMSSMREKRVAEEFEIIDTEDLLSQLSD